MGKSILSKEEIQQFNADGYLVVRGALNLVEVEEIKSAFMQIHAQGRVDKYFEPVSMEEAQGDILKVYPRVMQAHYYNDTSLHYMIHPKVIGMVGELLGEEAFGTQSMFYFKPPGAKGQALHQDNYYLKVEPGTCIAAWTAIDYCDRDNGGMMVVPKSGELEIICPTVADPKVSFTQAIVHVPKGMKAIDVVMEPGDTLFFNGKVIHGSGPNRSKDRFRRAFICHYVGASTTKIGSFFNKLYGADGAVVEREANEITGPCGDEFAGLYGH
ncbi:phytanoyl-CoA dioxygenase family protein [Paenibacillus psychroresistens]|uniref:phytanoyl-CoA dioxygenase family protein n=1 Tax=Paenibacillus psychroresistens TaxID=1778678 RepID=UPI001D053F3E|nr:phytanoyl-CoA dioxygenase family protein [Paenibacillus psychroresistens]